MSHTVSIQQASASLRELVRGLVPGDEIVLTDNNRPVARIIPSGRQAARIPGAWIGKLEVLDEGDDVILEHFQDYLP
jgi:antitoxin (DNA-binding transcriptional repressor) of toxin-antitoxin stability system